MTVQVSLPGFVRIGIGRYVNGGILIDYHCLKCVDFGRFSPEWFLVIRHRYLISIINLVQDIFMNQALIKKIKIINIVRDDEKTI